jgi:hypothetical protein
LNTSRLLDISIGHPFILLTKIYQRSWTPQINRNNLSFKVFRRPCICQMLSDNPLIGFSFLGLNQYWVLLALTFVMFSSLYVFGFKIIHPNGYNSISWNLKVSPQ